MGVVDFAAFDPVFWMHHANCDRLFALWQALNPLSYVISKVNAAGTFATQRGTLETVDSPLAPFWKSEGVFWTAADARDTRNLNYTYPELINWANLDPKVRNNRIRSDINALYGRTAPWGTMNSGLFNVAPSVPTLKPAVSTFGTLPTGGTAGTPRTPAVAAPPAAGAPAQQPVNAPIDAASSSASGVSKKVAEVAPDSFEIDSAPTAPNDNKHYNEWIANITVEKYAAKTTFFVYIFLGDFNPDPAKWGEDPNLVGTHVVFANNIEVTGCANCRDQAEQHKLVTGTIPLTGALGDRLGKDKIGSLEPAEIVPLLKKDLHWRIQTHNDKVIERTDIPSLKVSVARISVALPDNINEFPTWGTGVNESAATSGRPGGAGEND